LSYLAQRDLKKRRKIGEDGPRGPIEGLTDGEIGAGGWRRMPDGVLKGHKGRVGALGWAGKDVGKVVYSGGWDGSLRGWDVETGANVVVRVSFLSISLSFFCPSRASFGQGPDYFGAISPTITSRSPGQMMNFLASRSPPSALSD